MLICAFFFLFFSFAFSSRYNHSRSTTESESRKPIHYFVYRALSLSFPLALSLALIIATTSPGSGCGELDRVNCEHSADSNYWIISIFVYWVVTSDSCTMKQSEYLNELTKAWLKVHLTSANVDTTSVGCVTGPGRSMAPSTMSAPSSR